MNILVINGSPKGDYSITLQTVLYLKKRHPEHHFEVLNAGQRIKALEKDFAPALEAIAKAELLLFAYPVYTFIAPCQLHRFIELMKEHNAPVAGKYMSQISTSKHFFDATAHRYVQENGQDLGMKVLRGLSADMDDLLTQKGQQEAELFLNHVLWCMEQGYCEPVQPAIAKAEHAVATVPPATQPMEEKPGDIVIVTDLLPEDTRLSAMIERFRRVIPRKTRIINLREYPFKGGCLGCFNCATDGVCIYKDGFDSFLRDQVQSGEAIVYAFTIRDHSMGALFKMYDDRQFCNGHRTVTVGMPVGYLVCGDYLQESNLQTIIEGHSQVGQNPLAGVATDESDPNAAIDQMAGDSSANVGDSLPPAQKFLGRWRYEDLPRLDLPDAGHDEGRSPFL